MKLTDDIVRCFGHGCSKRESCARFKQWKGGERTQRVARLCAVGDSDGDKFISNIDVSIRISTDAAYQCSNSDDNVDAYKPFDCNAEMREAGHKPSDFYEKEHRIE